MAEPGALAGGVIHPLANTLCWSCYSCESTSRLVNDAPGELHCGWSVMLLGSRIAVAHSATVTPSPCAASNPGAWAASLQAADSGAQQQVVASAPALASTLMQQQQLPIDAAQLGMGAMPQVDERSDLTSLHLCALVAHRMKVRHLSL